MIGIDDALIAGAGANLIGGIIGDISSAGDRAQALRLAEESVKRLEAIGIPTIQAQQITLQHFKSAGKLTPELEQTIKQGPSNLSKITTNPAYKAAALSSLSKLRGVADSGGMTLEDKANLERATGSANASARGAREAILSSIRSRGQGGSGLELAAQLDNAQKAADTEHQASLDAASAASKRALEAISSSGQLATNLQGQEFGEKAQQASAQDAIDRFNTVNTQDVQSRNVGRTNSANQYNLANDQRISDANTNTANQEETYNKSLYQQQFNDEMNKGIAEANARSGQGSQLTNAANRTGALWSGLGQGVGQTISSAADRDLTREYLNKKYGSGSSGGSGDYAGPDEYDETYA